MTNFFATRKYSLYLLQEAVLIILISYFVLLNGTTPLLLEQNIQWMSVVILASVGLVWLIAGRRASTPLGGPLALFMLAFLVSTAVSIDPRRSLTQFILTAAGVLLFTLSADLVARGWPSELFVKALLIAGLMEVGLVGVGVLAWYRQWLQAAPGQWLPALTYRPALANILAMFANCLLLLGLARLAFTRAAFPRWLLALTCAALLALIYLTSSRGGWLGTAAGLASLAALLLAKRGFRLSDWIARVRARPALSAVIGAAVLIVLAAAGFLALRQLTHPTHGSALLSRSEYWPPAWHAFLQHPLFGQGPYTYASSYLAETSVPTRYLYVHGHSILLNTLTEMGLVGFLAFGWLIYRLAKTLFWRYKEASGLELALVAGASAGAVALFTQGLVDCIHTDPLGVLPLVFALGAALGQPARVGISKPRRPWWVLGVIALLGWELYSVQPLYKAVAAANSEDWPTAARLAVKAVQADPWSVIAVQQSALINGKLAADDDSGALSQAVAGLEEVVRREPYWAANHLNLGALYRQQGDMASARREFQRAVDCAPRWGMAYLNLGLAAEQSGDSGAASAAYLKVLELSPNWRRAGFWQQTPLRQQAQAAWLANQPAQPAAATLEQLRAAASRFPQTTRPYLDLASAEVGQGNWAQAEKALQFAALTWYSETDRLEMNWLRAKIAAGQGDIQTAASQGGQVLDAYLAPAIFGPGSYGGLRYAPFMFRRPAVAMELLPQVAVIYWTPEWEDRAAQVQTWAQAAGDTALAGQVARARQAGDALPNAGIH